MKKKKYSAVLMSFILLINGSITKFACKKLMKFLRAAFLADMKKEMKRKKTRIPKASKT